jgi:hypothetical protein
MHSFDATLRIFFEKNILKALLSEIKVLSLWQQIPPRFPLTSVPGRNFYFIPINGIYQTTNRLSQTVRATERAWLDCYQ